MGLNILGVIVNKYPLKTNDLSIIHLKEELEKHCNTKLLGIIPEINIKNNVSDIEEIFKKNINLDFLYEVK